MTQKGTISPCGAPAQNPAGGKGAQTEFGLHERLSASTVYEQVTGNYGSTFPSLLRFKSLTGRTTNREHFASVWHEKHATMVSKIQSNL